MARTDESFSAIAPASGNVTLTFRCPRGRPEVTVEQVSHNGMVPGGIAVGSSATATLFKNNYLVSRTVAQGGVIAGEPPVKIRQSDVLTLKYTGCVPGSAVEMTVFYDDGIQ